MACVLVVDDEALMRALFQEVAGRMGHTVLTAGTLAEGLALGAASGGVDAVLLDVLLPDGSGLARLRDFAALPGRPEVMIITGCGDGDAAESALRSGAWEYLVKPVTAHGLTLALRQMLAVRARRQPEAVPLQWDSGLIMGTAPAMLHALRDLAEAAASDVNVLILGETGVGKEVFAKMLYRNSLRAGRPYVTVDCASLPETLVESQLFGHSRGAFTGADRMRRGLLLAADKGTLFLDEVGDLPLAMQGAFLRALELRCFRPLGEVEEVCSDFRVISATNRDLEAMVQRGEYRGDLLFRLQGVTIRIPPLRERQDEIPLLADQVVTHYCIRHELPQKTVTQNCLDALLAYGWPGNVRELTHSLERACVAAGEGDSIFSSHLPTPVRVAAVRGRVAARGAAGASAVRSPACAEMPALPEGDQQEGNGDMSSLKAWKARAEETYVRRLMRLCGGDAREAATRAGVSRGHWYELLKKYPL